MTFLLYVLSSVVFSLLPLTYTMSKSLLIYCLVEISAVLFIVYTNECINNKGRTIAQAHMVAITVFKKNTTAAMALNET